MTLDARVKRVLSKENTRRIMHKNAKNREQLIRVKEKYDDLKARGLINDDSYSVATIEQNSYNKILYTV